MTGTRVVAVRWALACRSGGDPADVELGDQLGVVEHGDRYRAVANDREASTANGRSPSNATTPAAPLMSAGRT
jgi:hypothetical protein